MTEAGLHVDAGPVRALGYEPCHGSEALRELAVLRARQTAVVVANVNAALGVLFEAGVLGIRVPEDLSIVAIRDA